LFTSTVRFEDGHNVLRFEIHGEFPSRAGAVAAKVADEVMSEAGLTPSLLDLAVVAPGDPAFVDAFSAATGIRAEIIAAADPLVHTAGFLGALRAAQDSGRMPSGSAVLFAAAAAGITAGAVLYQA
jgi:3-oxoacyl-[acyl-carrier-protein] synthase III